MVKLNNLLLIVFLISFVSLGFSSKTKVVNAIIIEQKELPFVINLNPNPEAPRKLEIKSSNISVPIKFGPIKDGSWEVFEDSASYAEGSSYLNDTKQNTIIFAHARKALFKNLSNTDIGDEITIYGDSNIYRYSIVRREKISPENVNALMQENGDFNVTLFTCEGTNDEYRLLIRAKLIDITEINENEEVTQIG
ncbi:hypothetical protein CO178_01120 [candidate division WWE3 bacterium CG_4_9_14_3_um_filter_34_6]|uniref:Sortase n=1 Tax=candidate division WWE3 bacterium CG_4_9_14_3_um_filter_34_6 TaxID=1975079 RepID=A0A2M7X4B3_UNCKA|nr:MAG: hypothetical protein CO178_01120 [candidate division WWE3 bacterium CG_4_9_14_3_um_filter_34_6]